jgi:propionyl-CoA carboxylase beta chain
MNGLSREKIGRLRELREKACLGGGKDKIESEHKKGKLTARERIQRVCDADSFVELNWLAEHQCYDFDMEKKRFLGDGVVAGYGKIDGRYVSIFAQDATQLGGSAGVVHGTIMCKAVDNARIIGVPFIGLNDSAGARIQEGMENLKGYGALFFSNTMASGIIPQISMIMGNCAGGAAYSPAITDFLIMAGKSQMFITGPTVAKAVIGEDVTMEDLGGSGVHSTISGNCDFVAKDEVEAFEVVKRLLSFLPSNFKEKPPHINSEDSPHRKNVELLNLVPDDPKKPYDMYKVINSIVDNVDFLEIKKDFAKNIIIGFARLNGNPVGIVANQPLFLGGSITIDSSDKQARFIRFCDCFNIPIIFLMDVPGYLPGKSQEQGGIIRHGAKVLFALSESKVPKISIILRKGYGGAVMAMGGNHEMGTDYVFAWPGAEIAVMGSEAAVEVLYAKQIANAPDPNAFRKGKIKEYEEKFANPFWCASRRIVDDIIEPKETRSRITSALELLSSKEIERPQKKHGNIPL